MTPKMSIYRLKKKKREEKNKFLVGGKIITKNHKVVSTGLADNIPYRTSYGTKHNVPQPGCTALCFFGKKKKKQNTDMSSMDLFVLQVNISQKVQIEFEVQ